MLKTRSIKVIMSAAEKAVITSAAEADSLTASAFMRRAALDRAEAVRKAQSGREE